MVGSAGEFGFVSKYVCGIVQQRKWHAFGWLCGPEARRHHLRRAQRGQRAIGSYRSEHRTRNRKFRDFLADRIELYVCFHVLCRQWVGTLSNLFQLPDWRWRAGIAWRAGARFECAIQHERAEWKLSVGGAGL